MRAARLEYRGNFWLTLLTLFFFCMMLSLGLWQLERGFVKRERLLKLAQDDQPMTNRDLKLALVDDNLWFQSVRLQGHWTRHNFLLDNSIYKEMQTEKTDDSPYCFLFSTCAPFTGRTLVGYRLFTLFSPRDSQTLVLVERGWLPVSYGPQRFPTAAVPSSTVLISGLFVPNAGNRRTLRSEEILGDATVQLVQSLSAAKLTAALNRDIYSVPVVLSHQSTGALSLFAPLANFSYMNSQRHWGYAAQWFLMALVLLFLYACASFKIHSARNR